MFRKIHRKTPVPDSLFNKVADLRPAASLKRDSRILRNFTENLFNRIALGDSFCT